MTFSDTFTWGTATSSYQIEGAYEADGRSPSIWDTLCAREGAIDDKSNGDVACDHYHRWQEDLDLIKRLGFQSYRFSIAWPRVLPDGRGQVNAKGLGFYERLVDRLLELNIQPCVTLYHWDLPQVLEDEGGWPSRDVAKAFVEYTSAVVDALGDRVPRWVTHNEPWCAAMLGYHEGRHAPGRTNLYDAVRASHHMLLSHGWATRLIRERVKNADIGIVLNPVPGVPASDTPEDREAFRRFDGVFNRWYLDPLYKGHYPEDVLNDYAEDASFEGKDYSFIEEGDTQVISEKTDFLGINYYSRAVIASDKLENRAHRIPDVGPEMRTDMGWEVYPTGLYDLMKRIHGDYKVNALIITENGAAYDDGPDASGRVQDHRRTAYIHGHLAAVKRAISDGIPVTGYYVWSLMDNFEWSFGYTKRFGIVYVDYETQQRFPKDSALWLSKVMQSPNTWID